MPNQKVRLDALLFARGLFPSREAARRAIMAGLVARKGELLDKPGTMVRETDDITVAKPEHNYVSRGGLKLEKALSAFQYDLSGKIVIDVGASTGGFTDCALQHGAQQVYAVDVGYGQLAWKLRNDPRVQVFERMNFRHADAALFSPPPSTAVMDVSFISTQLLLPKLREVVTPGGDILSLVKPQFEAGRDAVGKGGIVRDPAVHLNVICRLLRFIYEHGMSCCGLEYSPISGGDGNIEYLAWWKLAESDAQGVAAWQTRAEAVVKAAWLDLNGQYVEL